MTSFLSSIGKKKKTHEQLVISTKLAVLSLIENANQKEEDRVQIIETIGKFFSDMKVLLCGTPETPDIDEEKAAEMSKVIQLEGLATLLIPNLDQISVEARKEFVSVFAHLLKKNVGGFVEYMADNSALLDKLMQGYASESALSCGSLIRECLRYEVLAAQLLVSEGLWDFFTTYVHLANFDSASDAFNTLKELLTVPKHRHLAEAFMQRNCDKLLEKYDVLLQSENYVTRRRSLKLLGEILLDRNNYTVMMRYISSKHNLKTIMNLLRHKSAQIQLESFHVFKIFVANPAKTAEIESTLFKNRDKLIVFLEAFHTDNEDPQFLDEKRLLIDTLQQLTEPMVAPPPAPSTSTTVASTPSFSATEISEATVDGQDSDTADPALPAAMHRVCMSDATTTTAVSLGEEVVPNSVA